MITLDNEQSSILELLKASLFNITPVISKEVNWDKLFELAKAQCIVPLLAPNIPAAHRNKWLAISSQSKARFMRLLYEQNTIIRLFKDNRISLVVFKGTAAGIYYPIPSARTYGDIDIYISEEHLDIAKKLLENNGYIFITSNKRHCEFEKNDIEVELHSRFSCRFYNDIEHIISNGLINAVEYNIANNSFPGLRTYENGLILLGHIMQHLKTTGVGLRQIIDWMMFVHKELDDATWNDYFKEYAVEAGLEKLAITVTYMCKKWLGLHDLISWCDSADEAIADQFLYRLLEDGNFGKDRAPAESIKESIRKEGLFKFLQRKGMSNWSLAKKYAFFRPFAWLFQLCCYGFKGIYSLFNGKKIFMKNNHNMSIYELLKNLE